MELFTTVTGRQLFLRNLKLVMDARGLSHSDVARLAGFSRQQVGNLFNGDEVGINTNTTDKMAVALGFKEGDLIDQDFDKKFKKNNKG